MQRFREYACIVRGVSNISKYSNDCYDRDNQIWESPENITVSYICMYIYMYIVLNTFKFHWRCSESHEGIRYESSCVEF